MGDAALTSNAHRLVLYEPSLGIAYPAGSIEDAVAAGDVEAMVATILVGILDMTENEVDALRSSGRWPAFLATVPALTRECRFEARLGLPTRPVRQDRRSYSPAGGLREPS
jgi:hypothetical protein